MNNEVVLRMAKEDDFEPIFLMLCELEGVEFKKEVIQKIYLENLNNQNIYILVVEENDNLLGFGTLYVQNLMHHAGKVAEIQELFISEEARGKNLGSKIIIKFEEIAKKEKCVLIEVASSIFRSGAHKFYEKNEYLNTHFKFTKKLDK